MTARFSTLPDWLQWQETLHPSTIDLGLSRIRSVAIVLFGEDFVAQQPLTITVAGTNGKGSCVTALSALLHGMGKCVGSFTSPHLFRYNERIRINGEEVSDEDLCTAFAAIDAARGEISLTYFEFNALAAFWVFKKYRVDVQVLEVGLGGRLDAVNLVDADIAVITNIALDHVDWLGDTREKIGAEKAGILRSNGKLVYGEADMPASIREICNELHVGVRQLGGDFSFIQNSDAFYWNGVDIQNSNVSLISNMPALPLPSVACALQVLAWLNLWGEKNIAEVLPNISLAGRLEKITKNDRLWILDVAHNAAGAQYLAQRLEQEGVREVVLVFSAMADKDITEMLSVLEPLVSCCILFTLQNNPRAATLEQLTAATEQADFDQRCVVGCENVQHAMEVAGVITDQTPVLVCGSFFTVAAVKSVIQ